MKKRVFLYLYPIEEYTKMFLYPVDTLYDEWNIKRPLPILNECIQKRYRDKGYQVVFGIYKDKEVFGIEVKTGDKIIYTDICFQDNSEVDENGVTKKDFVPKYPNIIELLGQLGEVDELVVGGYHFRDCVKKVAETAMNIGIPTLVDLDLTDLFFNVYKMDDYFKIDEYSPMAYKEYIINEMKEYGEPIQLFFRNYDSPVYGFDEEIKKKRQ